MNNPQTAWLDSYLEEATPTRKNFLGPVLLLSAGFHLALLYISLPYIELFQIQQVTETVTGLTVSVKLQQRKDSEQEAEDIQNAEQIPRSSPENSSTVEELVLEETNKTENETVSPEISGPAASPITQNLDLEAIAADTSSQEPSESDSLEKSVRNNDLSDPNYNGNIFDPRVREKILASRAKSQTNKSPTEVHSYIDNTGAEVIVNGDTCYKGTVVDQFSGTVWSLPYRCPWVPTQSEKMIANINAAMRERFGQR